MAVTLSTLIFLIFINTEVIGIENFKLVTVLFRHGDRTPDLTTLYPLDPYFNESYYPVGIGQLTNKGKQRQFEFGQLLRQRYDSFLGDTYYPDLIEAVSTQMDRAKTSLQLVLAGAFPPKSKDLEWNPLLNWQPIPYNYTLDNDLFMTINLKKYCPKYAKLYNEYLESPAGINFMKNNFKTIEYLNVNTGSNYTADIGKIWGLYTLFLSQVEWGLKLPQWTDAVFPDPLEQITTEIVRFQVATTKLKQLSGGHILKKIIDNMIAKAENKYVPEKRKLIVYSAHDVNVAYLSGVFDQEINHPIPYGGYYIIELVEIDGVNNVRIYTNDHVTQNITAVKIPDCPIVCPLKDFVKLLKKYIPDRNACFSSQKR